VSYQSDSTELLEINDLCVDFCSEGSWRNVVDHVSYTLMRGRTLGIVGESGSGKSVSSMALMGLLPSNARVSGTARFHAAEGKDVDLLRLPEKELRTYRGSRISMVFQEPMTSLNPVRRCGAQVVEMLRLHEDIGNDEARERVIELFKEVLLPRPEKIFDSYPHEISGGQKQRVMIAMALVCHPDIVIADEPTTALDVTVQKTILELLRQLQQRHNIGVIFISHDLGVIAQIADDVAVMYHGRIVEQGPVGQILHHPQHPYTQGLLACRPPLEGRPLHLPTVAEFMQRQEDAPSEPSAPQPTAASVPTDTPSAVPLLQVRDLEVAYTLKKSVFGRPLQQLMAVDHVSFDVMQGETLGLVGESGCGKTTLGRTLLHLVDAASGSIGYKGQRLDQLTQRQMRTLRPKMQIIFQDPYSSLNPRITIGDAIMEPLQVYGKKGGKDRVVELMEQVGLEADWYDRYPHELSGGQRQRVCIARALILDPELVVCDESVSALDVSVQAQVLNLLNDLKRSYGYTYIFISHDLSVVRFLSDRIMVMRQGRIVESGPADELYRNPQQEYTRMLIDAIPRV
jgi:peptide/nickel transport system ATP-binding protein